MNKLKIVVAIMACVLAAPLTFGQQTDGGTTNAAFVYKYKTPKLTRAQFDALLVKPDHLLIIDVRRPDELTSIGGFPVYLSIQADKLEQETAFIPKDRTIVTVSNHAGRAGAAADFLASKGFKVVGAVGVKNYEEEGGKLTKIVPVAPGAAAIVKH